MCHKSHVCTGMLLGGAVGMIGGALACHWCHQNKRVIRRRVNMTARKVGNLIENVNDML